MIRIRLTTLLMGAAISITLAGPTRAQQAASSDALEVRPGELVIDPPTLINLGFEWLIEGDANRNASVAVSYRKQGETEWLTGMPLLRLHHERVEQADAFNLVLPNMFAGSILDLEPGTACEVRLVMSGVIFYHNTVTSETSPGVHVQLALAEQPDARSEPNVNDDSSGAAPDLGALEAGQPLPIYGPRPRD